MKAATRRLEARRIAKEKLEEREKRIHEMKIVLDKEREALAALRDKSASIIQGLYR
jgi:hypothetical protein